MTTGTPSLGSLSLPRPLAILYLVTIVTRYDNNMTVMIDGRQTYLFLTMW